MSIRAPRRFATTIALPTAVAAGVAFAAPAFFGAPALAGHEDDYRGTAKAVQIRGGLAGTEILNSLLGSILPTGVAFPEGGDANLLELPESLAQLATLEVLEESSDLNEEKVLVSEARTAGLTVAGDVVGAQVLEARCSVKDTDVEGGSKVVGLQIAGGQKQDVIDTPVTIEIPESLASIVTGGVFINEEVDLEGGGKLFRALRVSLKIDPAGLSTVLKTATGALQETAEQLKAAVEESTGKSLEDLLKAPDQAAKQALGGADQEAETKEAAPAGTETEARGAAGERVQRPAVETRVAESRADAAGPAAPAAVEDTAAADAQDAAAAETASAADEASVADAASEQAQSKNDGAAVDRSAAEEQQLTGTEAEAQAAGEAAESETVSRSRVERDAKSVGEKAGQAEAEEAEAATDAEAAAGDSTADAAAAQQTETAATAQAQRAAATDRAMEAQAAQQADQAAAAAAAREATRAENTKGNKSDGASLSADDRAQAPTGKDAEEFEVGLVGLEVIISEVSCAGAAPPKKPQVKEAEPKEPKEPKKLPETGGNGDLARDLTAAGLGLLVVGSAAVFVSRRRRTGGLHAK